MNSCFKYQGNPSWRGFDEDSHARIQSAKYEMRRNFRIGRDFCERVDEAAQDYGLSAEEFEEFKRQLG